MSDSPEPQPQSQPSSIEQPVSAGLVPPPSLGDSLVAGEVGSSSAALPRSSSTASFAPEACHIEDIDSGCAHEHEQHSILHSTTHTPASSRNTSRIDITYGSVVGGKGVYDSDGLPEEDEGEDDGLLEMKVPNNDDLEDKKLHPSVATTQIDTITQENGINPPPLPQSELLEDADSSMAEKLGHTSPTQEIASVEADSSTAEKLGHASPNQEIAPVETDSSMAEKLGHASPTQEIAPVEADSSMAEKLGDTSPVQEIALVEEATTVSSPPATLDPIEQEGVVESDPISSLPTPGPPEAAEDINWKFDNMTELQAHITGPDPFEQLRAEAPARSSTFPPVPPHDEHSTTAHYENEKALFNMMASEVATGDGDRGMFDSPSAEHGEFFGAPDDSAEDLFNNVSRSETADDNIAAMMGQVLDAAGIGGPAIEASDNMQEETARFDEGVPLISHSPEDKEEEPGLFDDIEVKFDDFLGGSGENNEDKGQELVPGLERKSTEQVVEAVTHPYHSAVGVATSVATVNSNVLGNDDLESKSDSPFNTFASTAEEESQEDDFFSQIGQQTQVQETSQVPPAEEEDDLTARWKAALAGDILDDGEGFLTSDDEGFLPDSDDEGASKPMAPIHGADGKLQGFSSLSTGDIVSAQTPSPVAASGRYTPQPQIQQPIYGAAGWQPQVQPPPQQAPLNPYAPHPPVPPPATQAYFKHPATTSPYAAFGQPPKVPEKKAQSFVDKKEGYQSPYDLPMDVTPQVIRKRPSNLGPTTPSPGGIPPPARSSSTGGAFSPAIPPVGPPKPKPQTQQFFEELPMMPTKSRTTSAIGYSPSPTGHALPPRGAGGFAPPPGPQRPVSTQGFYAQSPQQQFSQPVSASSPQQTYSQPFAPQQNTANNRYSPAPRGTGGYTLPLASAPPGQGYQPPPIAATVPNTNLPYTSSASAPPAAPTKYPPRPSGPPQVSSRSLVGTSAPPVQPPVSQQPQDDVQPIGLRRFSSDPHGMHSSRPGTARSISVSNTMDIPREEEESLEDPSSILQNNDSPASVPASSNSRYTPSRGPGTPTPGQVSRSSTFSPPLGVSGSPKYSTNQSRGRTTSSDAFSPPPRAQTQSPGIFGRSSKTMQRTREPYERPSSAFAHSSTYSHSSSLDMHQRTKSLQINFIAPTDETGRDELKRWQGAPVFCWGFGGNVAVMFPRRAHRYTSDGQQPMIKCSPGEVKIKNIKDILPLEEIEGKFPGPAWGGSRNKGKKKEMLPWMTSKIDALQQELEGQGKRAEERILLWKVVRLLLENDGVLEGNPGVEAGVRAVLTPEIVTDGENGFNNGHGSFTMVGDISANMQGPSSDRVDPEAVRSIKTDLLKGDRTAAVWHAADKRLWSHALLIAGTVGKDLWKQVVQEFVKHEVKTLGEGVESLAVLYEIFAGNWAESVDELVSASTRVGVPMLGGGPNAADNVEDKLDRWRETLGLVLNNRSPGDSEAILALGKLLVSYGRIEAGHICYIFARQGPMGGIGAVLGGHDDPASHFTLLGADPSNFTPRDVDAVMLSEIYELALSLTSTPHPAFPHLLPYKLHRAMVRAENGHKGEAQKYVDAIEAVMRSWGKPSPYFHARFIASFEDLKTRLSIAPKDNVSGAAPTGAGKWLPKLNSETVTTSVWEAFHTFVNGEKDENGAAADSSGIDPPLAGPFGRISSESPVISRVQSSADLYGGYNSTPSYNAGLSGPINTFQQPYQPQAPIAGSGSKYAPQARNSYEGQTSPYSPMANHQHKSSMDSYTGGTGYEPSPLNGNSGWSGGGYEPSVPSGNPYGPDGNSHQPNIQQQQRNPYDSPQPSSNSTADFGGNTNTYGSRSSFDEQPSTAPTTGYDSPAAPEKPSFGGYEPPSTGGYEPPSDDFVPFEPAKDDDEDDEKNEKPKPKKKGFMDDDDDEELLKKAEKVNQEAAKKKAEEEKKQTAADSGAKKGWLSGWFGKKEQNIQGPIKAKLGEESSFVYDPDLKRWVNKKAGEQTPAAAKPAPPPKRSSTPTGTSTGMPSRPSSVAPPPPSSPRAPTPAMTPTSPTPTSTPGTPNTLSAPPPPLGRSPSPAMSTGEPSPSLPSSSLPSPSLPSAPPPIGGPPGGPPGTRTPGSGPPSRPPTSMSSRGGDAMDDLLGPPGASVSRKSTPGAGRKARGKNRYVEVIPGQQ